MNIEIRGLIPVCLVLTLCGCGSRPTIAPLEPDAVIVAFGDSITYGTGGAEGEGYPAALAPLVRRRVVNSGVPGELSVDGLKRLPSVLAQYRPQLVVVCHGGNDILQRRDQGQTSENVSAMVEMIHAAGADVVLLGVPQPSLGLKPPAFYEEIAKRHDVPYDEDTLRKILLRPSMRSDHVHMNGTGHALLAQAVADTIERSVRE